ncbi:MAG: hypothetical protein NT013_24245 [Planctomycetia bacterium]|nr:hypothetical protein [Planctomycetia bacterium]
MTGRLTQWHPFLIVLVSRSLLVNSVSGTRMIVEDFLPMTLSHHTGSWRWLFRACLVAFLLITSATSGFAQTRASVPSAEQQKESAKLLEEIHKLSRLKTAPEKQDVVKKLMASSRDKSLASDQRYGVLTTVIPLAKDVGDFASWLEAVNALVGAFEVDANKEKPRLLVEYLEANKSGAALKPAAVDEALSLARAAAQENRYADAISLLSATETAVRRPPAANALNKVVAETRDAVTAREKDWKAFQTASTKLGTNADDPAANLAVGRWHLLQQGDWKTALPFLAKVSDAKWKAAAEREQTAPLDATVQFAVGEAWWKIAENESGAMKTALLVHAGEWYARAQPNLTSVLEKELVTKRLDQIAPLKGAAPVKPAGPVNPNPNPSVTQTPPPAKPGEWIDLLEWSEGVDWAPRGIDWNANVEGKPTKNGITLKPKAGANFPLPAIIDGDYEFEMELTLADARVPVFFVGFPVGLHHMGLQVGESGDHSGLHGIDGEHAWSKKETQRTPSLLGTNKRHRLRIRTRHDDDNAEIKIDFDDVKDYLNWSGKYSRLGRSTRMLGRLSIGSHECSVTFHSAKVRMLSGTIRRDVITDADREQDRKNGFIRLAGEKASAIKVGASQFAVNQLPLGWGDRS